MFVCVVFFDEVTVFVRVVFFEEVTVFVRVVFFDEVTTSHCVLETLTSSVTYGVATIS